MAAVLADLPNNHDLWHLDAALVHVKSFRTAIDGGAHRGIWSRVLAGKFQRVIAFEPCAENFNLLAASGAECYAAALGDQQKRVGLKPGAENTGQWHVADGHSVNMLTVDSLELTDIDFIKLDVEGYELFALHGAQETIQRCRPVVMIEENGLCRRYGVEPGVVAKWLIGIGMRQVGRYNKDYVFAYG